MSRAIVKGLTGKDEKLEAAKEDRTVIVTIPNPSGLVPDVRCRFGGEVENAEAVLLDMASHDKWYGLTTVPRSKLSDSVPIDVGIANGPWKMTSRWMLKNNKHQGIPFTFKFVPAIDLKGAQVKDRTAVEVNVPLQVRKNAWRVVGFTKAGEEIGSGGSKSLQGWGTRVQIWMVDVRKNVARLELQTRPITWTAMGNVPVNPR